jgi:GNAT superfamily N-acetyltransferase
VPRGSESGGQWAQSLSNRIGRTQHPLANPTAEPIAESGFGGIADQLTASAERWLPTSPPVIMPEGTDGYFNIARITVPSQIRGGGIGTGAMEAIAAKADELGVTLTLTPSTDYGASSVARLVRFYRRFGFRPNRGRTADFETRAAMIRPPQMRRSE